MSFVKPPPDDGLKTRNMYRDFIKTQNLIKKFFFVIFLFFCETPLQPFKTLLFNMFHYKPQHRFS